MLKAEITRLIKEKLFYFIIAGIIIVTIYSAVVYYENVTYDSFQHCGYNIMRYETIEDVKALRKDIIESLSDNQLEEKERYEMERTLSVYDFLIDEKYVEYDDLIDYGGLNASYYANQFSYYNHLNSTLKIVISILLGIMASVIVTIDFQTGMQRTIYSRGCKRIKIIGLKYLTWLLCAIGIVIIASITESLLGLTYSDSNVQNILLANSNTAFLVNYPVLCLIGFNDCLLRTVFYGTIVFGISLFCENCLIAIIPNIVIYGIVFGTYAIDSPFINVVTQGGLSVFEYVGTNTFYLLFSVLIYVIIAATSLLSGIIYFNKKNII